MSLLLNIRLYVGVGCAEWYLALRRTLACARGEKALLVCIVFVENLLGLWVLSNIVRTNNWLLALSYAGGAFAGALLVATRTATSQKDEPTKPRRAAWPAEAKFQKYHYFYRQPVRTHGIESRPTLAMENTASARLSAKRTWTEEAAAHVSGGENQRHR